MLSGLVIFKTYVDSILVIIAEVEESKKDSG